MKILFFYQRNEQLIYSYTVILRSCVAFSGKNRILGVAAKNQMVTNMKNTIYGFKRLLGRKYNDSQVQRERQFFPYKISQQTDGGIGIHVSMTSNSQEQFCEYQLTLFMKNI